MWGAVIGDIVGSRFEFRNLKSKEFELFTPRNRFTDDTVMTLAVADGLMKSKGLSDEEIKKAVVSSMLTFGRRYPDAGYGGMFWDWLTIRARPYGSYGNGGAMRVSAVAWAAGSMSETERLARLVTEVSHDHPEGIKGAQAVAAAIFSARKGTNKQRIKEDIVSRYYPEIEKMRCDTFRPYYMFDETAQGSVPQALACFFESESFEDAIRTAVSVGGDSDTIAAIAGSVAEAYYGIDEKLKQRAREYLPPDLLQIIEKTDEFYG